MTTEPKILTDEQRESFKAQFVANGTHPHLTMAELSISLQTEKAVLQSPEIQELRRDAERLRHCLEQGFPQKWIQGRHGKVRTFWTERPGSQEEYSSAIAAIDAAMGTYQDNHQ